MKEKGMESKQIKRVNRAGKLGEEEPQDRKKRRFLRIGCLLVLISFVLTIASCPRFLEKEKEKHLEKIKKQVGETVSKEFPVVVVLKTSKGFDAKVIDYATIDELKRNVAPSFDYSFLIPKDQGKFIQHRLSEQQNPMGKFRGFELKDVSSDRQYIKVKINPERMYIRSWYEATDKTVIPKFYIKDDLDIAGGLILISVFIVNFIVILVSLTLLFYIIKWIMRKRRLA
jgi:hypothetical protein